MNTTMDQTMNPGGDILNFVLPKNQSSYIKVIGVGGGGSNAVNHMFRAGIKGVDFIVCNTDAQALENSPVPVKIHLGKGLGAGNVPQVAKDAAIEKHDEIRDSLKDARMLFITAGMGGGTGTGAAPVVASIAKEIELVDDEVKSILTVAIVTTPFTFEGRKRQEQAKAGIAELRKTVDAILVINNDKLREFGKMTLMEAFAMADNVLTTAAKGISEIITVRSYVQIDFKDVNTVMHDSGVALMGFGTAIGENRAKEATLMAMDSPLLNDNSIQGAKNMLLYLSYGPEEPLCMDEIEIITASILQNAGDGVDLIWGAGEDETLGAGLNITLIATGFAEKRALGERDIKHFTLEDPGSRKEQTTGNGVAGHVPAAPAAPAVAPSARPVQAVSSVEPVAPVQAAPVKRTIAVLDLTDEEPVFVDETAVVRAEEPEPARMQTELEFETVAEPVATDRPEPVAVENRPDRNGSLEKEVDSWFTEMNLMGQPVADSFVAEQPAPVISGGNMALGFDFSETAKENRAVESEVSVSENTEIGFRLVKRAEAVAGGASPLTETEVLIKAGPVADTVVKEEVSVTEGLLRGRCAATAERMRKLREFSGKIRTPQGLREIEDIPAYVRQNKTIEPVVPSFVSEASKHTIGKDGSVSYNNPPFLADQAD